MLVIQLRRTLSQGNHASLHADSLQLRTVKFVRTSR